MAKGKHAAALFEVIKSDFKRPEIRRSSAQPFSLPRWFSKLRTPRSPNQAGAVSSQPAVVATKPRALPAPEEPAHEGGEFSLKVDRDHHLISLRISFPNAITAGFALLVVVTLAFIVGRRHPSQPAGAVAANPSVLEVARAGRTDNRAPMLMSAGSPRSISGTPSAVNTPSPTPAAPVPAGDQARTIGLNYVIIQSWPDQKTAGEARDILIANGIPCTVENSPANYGHSTWFSVIGTTGFERIRTAEYENYVKTVEAIGVKFAGSSSKFKRFEPHPYKWRDAR